MGTGEECDICSGSRTWRSKQPAQAYAALKLCGIRTFFFILDLNSSTILIEQAQAFSTWTHLVQILSKRTLKPDMVAHNFSLSVEEERSDLLRLRPAWSRKQGPGQLGYKKTVSKKKKIFLIPQNNSTCTP